MSDIKNENYLWIKGNPVCVNEEIYKMFYTMKRKEKYLTEADQLKGLLYYDGWNLDNHIGVEFIPDKSKSTEGEAIQRWEKSFIWQCVAMLDDKYDICRLISLGYTEREIASIAGVSQTTIHRAKKRIFKELKKYLKNEF